MNNLKLLWLEPKVQFRGKGIATAWGDEMAKEGWQIIRDPARWEECDLVFFASESQLDPDLIGKKPTICYFWGWPPARMVDPELQKFARIKIDLMAKCTRLLVPGWLSMYQLADFGLTSEMCFPGVDTATLDMGGPVAGTQEIVFLSRLAPYKGLDILLSALWFIQPPPHLTVVGPGDRDKYEEMAKQLGIPVTFKEIEDSEKGDLLRSAGVLVHPSTYEGFGLPPLEAMYCGCPVIAHDIPQLRWLLQEDVWYFSSTEGLARAIVHVLSNGEGVQDKVEHGQKRVRNTFTLKHSCQGLWPHIHQVIKEYLAIELRQKPEKWAQIYDSEHRRNWEYSLDRFDPTWERHWRAQSVIEALKQCKAEHILDIACGAVYPTILARAGFTVHALDISPEAIRQVEAIATKWGVADKVLAEVGDANKLNHADNSMDAVIQAEIWEHVLDPDKIILEGLRVLKPGGYLIASTPMGRSHYDPMHLRIFNDEAIALLLSKVTHLASIKDIKKIAEGEGDPSCYFIVLEKREDTNKHTASNAAL